ncbi:MAG: diguanylate cyclase [Spirochaetales bacterium]|nr:diguanylate cyclase [Spirochaetales bacterium]
MSKTQIPKDDYPGVQDLNTDLKNRLTAGSFDALLLFDLDQFQLVNKTHGRKTGDRIIYLITEFLNGSGFKWYRIGGEEFAFLVEKTSEFLNGEDIRNQLPLIVHEKTGIQITISGGGLHHPGDDFGNDPRIADIIFATADQLLITAKKQGRDRILWLPDEPVRSIGILNAMVRFYREIARINSSPGNKLNPLTGLPEYGIFSRHLITIAKQSQMSSRPFALFLINSDSLKDLNRLQGPKAGDRFIIDIARILKDVIRGSDFISHLGQDEFAIILENTDKSKAVLLAERVKKAINERTEGTVSIGAYCGTALDEQAVLEAAKKSLKQAKSAGKNRVSFFKAE